MTDVVERLRVIADSQLLDEGFYTQAKEVHDAADEIERLRDKCDKQAKILQHLFPEKTRAYFICGEMGVRDGSGLPEFIFVCPEYGSDPGCTMRYKRYNPPPWKEEVDHG